MNVADTNAPATGGGFLDFATSTIGSALNVYRELETQKLQARIAKAQAKQSATLYATEQQTNMAGAPDNYTPEIALRFDWRIFAGVFLVGAATVALYKYAVK